MRAKLIKALAVIGTLAACALIAALVAPQPAVSLAFLEYKRWPHGAMLRLTNATQTTIRYRADINGGGPVFLIQASDGKVRTNDDIFTMPVLKPGKAVDFFVRLEPDAAPARVGILYEVPRAQKSRLALKFDSWLFRAKRWLGLKIVLPGQKEAWSQPLSVASRQPQAGK